MKDLFSTYISNFQSKMWSDGSQVSETRNTTKISTMWKKNEESSYKQYPKTNVIFDVHEEQPGVRDAIQHLANRKDHANCRRLVDKGMASKKVACIGKISKKGDKTECENYQTIILHLLDRLPVLHSSTHHV